MSADHYNVCEWEFRSGMTFEQRRHIRKALKSARRRTIAKGNDVTPVTPDDVFRMFIDQDRRCYYCRERLKHLITLDHVMPIARGGAHALGNIVLACGGCNWQKSDRLPDAQGGF